MGDKNDVQTHEACERNGNTSDFWGNIKIMNEEENFVNTQKKEERKKRVCVYDV